MKLVCVLLLFAFLNVSALQRENIHDLRNDYMREIYFTNYQLGLLDESQLDELIIHLLNSNLPIDAMVILLATPDYCDAHYKTSGDIERIFRAVMKKKYADDIHNPPTVDINLNQMELSNLGEARRDLIYPSINNILFDVEKGRIQLDHPKVCNLIALLESSRDPRQRIKEAIPDIDICTTVPVVGRVSNYKHYGNGIHRLDAFGEKGDKLGLDLV
ncbi:uncharacterized protein LOC126836100 [Adelges cooleyi]|uniref:uncharacterized protein LOC126836100 n=1 Tax=Adelges cooleyi TaxID=133065 RepID=UPI0021803F4F|nr:uncharacterized protein LOC126836100 [Adelges cooleyi]